MNNNIEEEVAKVLQLQNNRCENEREKLLLFLTCVQESQRRNQEYLKLQDRVKQLSSLLEQAEKKKQSLTNQLVRAHGLIENEKSQNIILNKKKNEMKKIVDDSISTLKTSNIPNVNRLIKKIETVEKKIANTNFISDSEQSTVNITETDSDSWHLFSDNEREYSSASSLTDGSENKSSILFPEVFESIKSRPHQYKIKKLILGETCCVCESRIQCGRQALICIYCRASVHVKCQQELAKPCIPAKIIIPGITNLEEFCTPFKPMIPGMVIHCVLFVETNLQNGLYSVPVYDKKVTCLKERFFKGKGVPNLNKYDITIVCAFLKEFFNLISPPIIPESFAKKFLSNVKKYRKNKNGYDELLSHVMEMPNANRDTLSFFILHLQKIAKSSKCNMDSYLLSKIFTPILVENSNSKNFDQMTFNRKIITEFINAPENVWERILLNGLS